MRTEGATGFLESLCCPCCLSPLKGSAAADGLACECGEQFPIIDGIPDLVRPRGQPYFPEDVATYDAGIDFMGRFLRSDVRAERARGVGWLELTEGDSVIDIGCGAGANHEWLLGAVGASGHVVGVDISAPMVAAACDRWTSPHAHFALANALYLPFATASFDAAFHVGSLNQLPNIPRALAEAARLVKPGGVVVVADEGCAPWLAGTPNYILTLTALGSHFAFRPPVEALPTVAADVRVHWLLGGCYYAIVFRVGRPQLDVDLSVVPPGAQQPIGDLLVHMLRTRDEAVRQALDQSAPNEAR